MQTHTTHTLLRLCIAAVLCANPGPSFYQADASLPPCFSLILYLTLSSSALWTLQPVLRWVHAMVIGIPRKYMLLLHLFLILVWSTMCLFHYHTLASKDQGRHHPTNKHIHYEYWWIVWFWATQRYHDKTVSTSIHRLVIKEISPLYVCVMG